MLRNRRHTLEQRDPFVNSFVDIYPMLWVEDPVRREFLWHRHAIMLLLVLARIAPSEAVLYDLLFQNPVASPFRDRYLDLGYGILLENPLVCGTIQIDVRRQAVFGQFRASGLVRKSH